MNVYTRPIPKDALFHKIVHAPGCGFLILAFLLASGCTPTVKPPQYDLRTTQAAQAKRLLDAGEFEGAARIYRGIADESSSPARESYQMAAVDALLKASKEIDARQYAETIQTARLSQEQRHRLYLFYSQLDLSSGNAEQALWRLEQIPLKALSPEERLLYHRQRAFALSLTGNPLESARERVQLHGLLGNPAEQTENSAAILETLTLMPVDTLEQLQPPPPDPLGGWMALARILKLNRRGSPELERQLAWWRQSFPSHPADTADLETYIQKKAYVFRPPTSIAVLLPESGPLAQAGRAIREGFVSAYYRHEEAGRKPSIRFYDSQSANIHALYRLAVAEGADFIVGPLQKAELETLAKSTELSAPILALNQIPGPSQENLFQFGLNPLDEAEQAANSAWSAGYRNALLLVPRTELGQRLGGYFVAYWRQLGGEVLETQIYDPGKSDFSPQIKQLLNLDESEQRYRQIKEILPSVKLSPGRRQDADFIFLVGYPREGRMIRPLLQFFHADSLPLFATSHIYAGRHDPSQDRDLDTIVFCDIPWLFEGIYRGEISRQSLQDSWQQPFPDAYLRLIALGIDAYNLIPHLGNLRHTRYTGATGNLYLSADNQIRRQLYCARFEEGIPRVLGAEGVIIQPATETDMGGAGAP